MYVNFVAHQTFGNGVYGMENEQLGDAFMMCLRIRYGGPIISIVLYRTEEVWSVPDVPEPRTRAAPDSEPFPECEGDIFYRCWRKGLVTRTRATGKSNEGGEFSCRERKRGISDQTAKVAHICAKSAERGSGGHLRAHARAYFRFRASFLLSPCLRTVFEVIKLLREPLERLWHLLSQSTSVLHYGQAASRYGTSRATILSFYANPGAWGYVG